MIVSPVIATASTTITNDPKEGFLVLLTSISSSEGSLKGGGEFDGAELGGEGGEGGAGAALTEVAVEVTGEPSHPDQSV